MGKQPYARRWRRGNGDDKTDDEPSDGDHAHHGGIVDGGHEHPLRCPAGGIGDASLAIPGPDDIGPLLDMIAEGELDSRRGEEHRKRYARVPPKYVLGMGNYGRIKYYEKGRRFVAECDKHVRCFFTRYGIGSDCAGKEGAGRPYCLMIGWLTTIEHDKFERDYHIHGYRPSLDQRVAIRERVMKSSNPIHNFFFKGERLTRGDEPDEPVNAP